jgi:hypothetical protein
MAINSVSSANSAVQQQQQQLQVAANQAQYRPTDGPRAEGEANRTPEAQVTSRQQEPVQRTAQPEQVERPEPPKPVTNAQGQKTGTIINTTA